MRMFSEWSPARCLLFGGVFAAASGLAFAQDVGADDAPADPPEVAEPAGGGVDADAGDGEGADQTEPGTGGELAVPPWRRPGSPFSRREDGAGQQATAMELSRELAPLLGPDGLPRTLGDAQVRADLRGVATRCDLLLRSLTDPSALQRLYETQARVHNALVQDAAAHGEAVEVARGLGKLREAAARLADLEDDSSAAAGGYWQMLADLIDANRTIDNAADRRVFVRELLSRYVEDYGELEALTPETTDYVLDARVALARLLDEAGEQRAALDALGPIAQAEDEHQPEHERQGEVRSVIDRGRTVGRPLELDLPLAAGGRWSLADQAGEPVLLHYYAPGHGDAPEAIAALSRAIEDAELSGFSIVSLHVGAVTDETHLPPWPLAVVGGPERQALAAAGLASVPMYVWIDADGRVAAIGKTLEVIRRFPRPADAAGGTDLPDTDDASAPSGPASGPDDAEPAAE